MESSSCNFQHIINSRNLTCGDTMLPSPEIQRIISHCTNWNRYLWTLYQCIYPALIFSEGQPYRSSLVSILISQSAEGKYTCVPSDYSLLTAVQ
ncbi:hypothetical protein CEXT_804921 [Caerostris extrusa]|uniref:Uncharacterized protein n=1 Tax=Caerostris extrusa TaxID=172846 RepID=A0AAV4MBT8_CAEEX|nr:hypothetical protein CEXT_804921 [Caerostris extrusa]